MTIHLPDWNEQYHSKHGALQEAKHVFLDKGLSYFIERTNQQAIDILEIGFGTGLNAQLTQLYSEAEKVHINYTGVEAYPIALSEVSLLNYPSLLGIPKEDFIKLHQASWETQNEISTHFSLTKRKQFFADIEDQAKFDLIYFDAFGARVQPKLWTEAIFEKMYVALKNKGVLVTYAAKGSVRRAMQSVGFTVERLPGPPGKREMLRALKEI